MKASSSHNNAGSAEPQIGDSKHLQNCKTGSFLSLLARELTGGGGRGSSSSTASDLPAMKSTSRNNSSGSNSSGATATGITAGKQQRLRKQHQQQHSYSEGSVCEEAREIDDIQSNKSTANEPPAAAATEIAVTSTTTTATSTNIETSNENDTKMVSDIQIHT